MPFNANDYTQVPWVPGVLPLTHEECLYVIEKCDQVRSGYEASGSELDEKSYTISNYNKIDNWTKAVNGDTYDVLQGYDPDYFDQGINEYGIIYPEQPVEEEQPKEGE